MDPIQEFSKVQLTLDNVIVPNERLHNTPSRKDGCPHDLELDLRIIGCEYIQSAGQQLRLPQVPMATAQVLFQRFFYSKSFVKYNVTNVAMSCIFLAAKIEENCRRVRDIANVFHHMKQKRMGRSIVPMEYMGQDYFKLKASIIKYERFILKELGFCVHIKHPHKLIIAYLQILELEKNTKLTQKAWNYMNDSLRTNVFVRFSPETIACACIFLSARVLRIGLPQKPPWWTVFDVSFEDIEAISLEVLALYRRPKVFLVDLEKRLNVIKDEFSKKQVEIREVNLKKTSAGSSAGGTSSATVSPISKLKLSPQNSSVSPSGNPLLKNSVSPIARNPKHALNNSSPSSPPPKKIKISCSPDLPSSSPPPPVPLNSSPATTDNTKPVISPIRVAKKQAAEASYNSKSFSDSYSEGSEHSPGPRENGIPEQYRRDFSKHKSRSKHHHHHSSRSSSAKGHRESRHHHHRRHQHQEESGRNRRGHNYQNSKLRRTKGEHHR